MLTVICKDHYVSKPSKKKINVRYATEKDKDILEEIEASMIWEHIRPESYKSPEFSPKAWRHIKTNSLAAEVDKKIVGFVEYSMGIDPHEQPAISVTDLAVLPDYQGIGVGVEIFNKLKEIGKREGFKRIYISTTIDNIPTIIFHLRNGAKIFNLKETDSKSKGRWGIPTKYDISFVYEF
jgi:ribosomal protein S18 acetylase RimI-like enzyme